uniref:Uncharacterized protein n=1 Tax=Panagrolaimus davidi TaxID=227884 RepID=A0A914NXI5_9BILA
MSERRIGPFIIDEPEFRYNNLLNDEEMNQLNIDDSNNTSSQSFMSHDRGNNEFSIWNNLSNDPPEPFQHHSNGFPSNRQQNSFFGIDDSSKAFTGGFSGSKDVSCYTTFCLYQI